MKFPRRVLDLLCLLLCLSASLPIWAQGPQADANLTLFSVIAAAVAADDKGQVYTSPLAQQLRKDLADKEIPSVEDIRKFLALNKGDYTKLVSFSQIGRASCLAR